MSANGDSADQAMRMTLQGIQVAAELALKIGGSATRSLSVFLYQVLSDQKKVKGKTKLKTLLKSDEELKIFAIHRKDLQAFYKEAKRYGILYHVVMKEKGSDGICDIMVRAKDADKIARIVDRLEIATLSNKEINQMIEAQGKEKVSKNDKQEVMSEQEHNDLLKEIKEHFGVNPTKARTEKNENLSEPFSKKEKPISDKPSVRKELEEIKQEQAFRRQPVQRKQQERNRRKSKHEHRRDFR